VRRLDKIKRLELFFAPGEIKQETKVVFRTSINGKHLEPQTTSEEFSTYLEEVRKRYRDVIV